jgi:hypothetical protein
MEKRTEERTLLDRYYSVDFLLKQTGDVYQFKLRDMSPNGFGILIKEGSVVLQNVKVGDILDIRYNPPAASGPAETFKTQIRHITGPEQGTTGGHFVIGLKIMERRSPGGAI